ncbi:MAG: cell division protein FtsA [Spirochaetaceae bacterium]|nr:cell division protein FtsA [Spirochaetaceae bacterium]
MANDSLVVGLDIGSTKVCAVIGERNERGTLDITGVGTSPSTGLEKGVVKNIEATLRAISAAIEEAEGMSGQEVRACWTGIGGKHITGMNSRGVVAVTGKTRETREIGPEDVDRVLEAARAIAIPMDRQILEVIPQSYIVDDQKGIRDPLNIIGVRLEAEVHIITCSVTSAQNLIKCVNRAGFRVNDLILQSLAAGTAVLTEEEKELGVVLIDLGGGTTEVVVYCQGAPYSTSSIPLGGMQVTRDISLWGGISIETAEKIKIQAGCCREEFLEKDESVLVDGIGGRPPQSIPRLELAQVIRPRVEEIFEMVKNELDKLSVSEWLGGGIVLTGGGAQLLGTVELAEEVFNAGRKRPIPIRAGNPLSRNLGGFVEKYRTPAYSTAIGLLLEGAKREASGAQEGGGEIPGEGPGLGKRLVAWLKGFF